MGKLTAKNQPDLSEFFKYSRPRRAPCRLGHAMTQLSDGDLVSVNAALDADKNLITSQAIIIWFEKRGVTRVSSPSIVNHRKKCCSCFEEE